MSRKIKSIGYWPTKWSQLKPESTALIEGDNELTYKELNSRINLLAHSLKNELKVKKGDRIGALLTNRAEFMEIWFAASKLGAILAPFNFRLAEEELEYLLEDTAPKALFYDKAFEEKVETVDPSSIGIENEIEVSEEGKDYENLVKNGENKEPETMVEIDEPCIIPYTGGTTGLPKGAVLTHSNVVYHALSMVKNANLTAKDTTLTVLPLFHTGGLGLFTAPTISQGATLVFQRTFDPEEVIETIEEKNVTIMFGVPTIYREIMETSKFEDAEFSSIKVLMNGGDYCPPEIMEKYQDRGIKFIHSYGLTESSPGVFANDYEDKKAEMKSREGSVGKPLFYSEVKIVDNEGNEFEQGETGELLTKGPHVIEEYWNKPEETKEAFTGEWLHTGDLARKDEDGYYYIEGRKKDMIVSGGENIYLPEVERVLTSHTGIKETAVIGVPNEKWGQVGKAIIVLEEGEELTEEEIVEHCQGKLAKYKIPQSFEFVDSLPVGPAGSVDKNELKEKYG